MKTIGHRHFKSLLVLLLAIASAADASLIRLCDLTASSVIFEHAENRDNAITFRDPPLVLAQSGTLVPDHVYELEVFGLIDKPGFFEATFFDTLTVALNVSVRRTKRC
jgi:hypothetical protein